MKLTREKIKRMLGQDASQVILGGGGSGDADLTGMATEGWVEENYISKAFFNRLFTIHSASSVIDPNDPDEEQTIDSIEALVGLWTEQYLSALGQGSGGGGGGGITLNDPLDAINSAGLSDPVTAGSALVWYGGAWTYSPSARLQVAGLNSSAAVSVTGSVTATSFVRQGGTSAMFLKADGSVDTTVYAAQDWVSQNFITIAFFETLFNAVDTNGTKVNANTTTGIDSIKAMFGFWTNQYLSALGQGSGGGGGGVTLNQPLSSINSAGLGAPSVSGSTLVWNGTTWTYSSSIGDTKNTAGSSQQPSGVQLYLIGASAQATWGVTYSNSGCYIGTDGYLYSGGAKVLTSAAGFVTGVSVNNGNPISPVNGVVALTDIMTNAGGTMTGSLSISGSGSHLSVGGNIGAQGTITSQDYITATGFKTPSGTSAGFLKADGSVDTTSYSTSDTLNTAGATAQPNSVIYLVGAGSYNSTYAVTYTNSGCYISADGYLYSGGVKVITSTSGLVSGISIGGDTPIEPTNGIVQIPAYPVNTDTLNTAGSTQKPSNVALYLVGASAQATYGQTYSDSGCYISADGYLYSGGVRVLTSGNTVQTITINNGTPISPTNGNININCLTSLSSSDVTTALGYTPAANSSLSNYVAKVGDTMTGELIINYAGTYLVSLKGGSVYNLIRVYNGNNIERSQWGWGISNNKEYTYTVYKGGSSGTDIKLLSIGDGGLFFSDNALSFEKWTVLHSGNYSSYLTDTLNTAGATAQPNSVIYLVGAGSYNSTYAVTYTNSGCYISADGYLYSGGSRVLTNSSALVTGVSVNGGTPVTPTNGIVALTGIAMAANYLPLTGGTLTGTSNILKLLSTSTNAYIEFHTTKSSTNAIRAAVGYYNNFALLSNETTGGRIGVDDSGTPQYWDSAQGTNKYTLYHSGNIPDYLLKSGGTMSGQLKIHNNSGIQIELKGDSDFTAIQYLDNAGKTVGFCGYSSQNSVMYMSYEKVQNNYGVLCFDNTNCYFGTSIKQNIILHSGNYSSYLTDTLNTAGATAQPNAPIYLVGAGNYGSTYSVTYTNSSIYIGTNNHIYCTGIQPATPTTGIIGGNGYEWLETDSHIVFARHINGSRTFSNQDLYLNYTTTNLLGGNTYINPNNAGKVGIGTDSPSYKLDVNGNFRCNDLTITTASGSTGSASIAADLTVSGHIYTLKIGNGMTNMRFETNGNVGIGVQNTSGYLLQVNGACAGTSWTNLSDMRQKNYIEDESIELWQVAGAPLFKFTWKNNAFGTDLHIGSSAQYWQTIVPEAVTIDGLGNLGLQYDVVALLAAITTAKKVQEHEQRIEELERENKVLWNMIASLKAA